MECSYRRGMKATTWIAGLAVGLLLALLFCSGIACSGSWTGSVGAVLGKDNKDGRVFVREAPSDMPAALAGVQVDDEVVSVDGRTARDLSPEELHQALSGKVGTKVRLQVRHGGETRDVIVERGPLKESAPPKP
jgi:C-terminal processing protease CtpA/Prc